MHLASEYRKVNSILGIYKDTENIKYLIKHVQDIQQTINF